jgi:(R,R)-butanediol dehydrogenase/meso-butanediol dehydrogenase/diacetyl reductase
MQALVYHGRKDVRLEDFPDPSRLAGSEVRLRVKSAGICHTDYNEYMHGPIYVAQSPHPRTGRAVPLILGHEFSGDVVEVGKDVRQLKVGDRVAINSVDSCRNCTYCRQGLYALCPSAAYIGFSRDGGLAQFAVVPEDCCHRLAPNVSYRAGALVEPLSVALHAVKQAGSVIGSRVAVVGGGAVGLCTLQALRAAGAREVMVIEKSEAKKPYAQQLGASAVVNPDQHDPVEAVLELTEGLGADTSFECVGSAAALRTAMDVTRASGTVCEVGIFPGPVELDLNTLMSQERRLVTSFAYTDEFPTVITMLSDGRLQAEPLITRTLPLARALEDGLQQYEAMAATSVRTIIEMDS